MSSKYDEFQKDKNIASLLFVLLHMKWRLVSFQCYDIYDFKKLDIASLYDASIYEMIMDFITPLMIARFPSSQA